ncbi:MAG TPA: WhiB family transcriptional regulator [Acidimicrobiia bacterium]|nr:WhiB family transcriptional regulator [Acidimicrobiia bacterium]
MIELLDLEPEFWREGAACADRQDVDFFPAPDRVGEIARAKALCGGCPVLDDCLAFAIETNQPDGIWGGFTAKERVRLRRRWLEDLRRAS